MNCRLWPKILQVKLIAPLLANKLHNPAFKYYFLDVKNDCPISYLTKIAIWRADIVCESANAYPLAASRKEFSQAYLSSHKKDIPIDLWHYWVAIQIRSASPYFELLLILSMKVLMEFAGGIRPCMFHIPTAILSFPFPPSEFWISLYFSFRSCMTEFVIFYW